MDRRFLCVMVGLCPQTCPKKNFLGLIRSFNWRGLAIIVNSTRASRETCFCSKLMYGLMKKDGDLGRRTERLDPVEA